MAANYIELDSLELSPDLIWTDRFKYSPVGQSSYRTLAGNLIVFSQALLKGRPVTLEAQANMGWLTEEQVQGLIALASVPGVVYNLTIYGETYQVMFRHHDPPALEMEPIVDGSEPSTWYTGTIKLITVEDT